MVVVVVGVVVGVGVVVEVVVVVEVGVEVVVLLMHRFEGVFCIVLSLKA